MAKTHHVAHHGYRQPEPSMHHAARHDRQMDAIDREHASRVSGGKGGAMMGQKAGMTQPAGGSAKINDPGPHGKSPSMAKDTAIKGLKKLAAGRPDTASGKNVA